MIAFPIPDQALANHIAVEFGRADPGINPTDADKAYAAGFFDGEGCITIAADNGRKEARGTIYNMRVGAAQNDPAPLTWLRDRWGGSVAPISRRTARGNTTHQWWCFSRRAAVFLRDVRPFLIVKADRADLALLFQSLLFNPGARGHTPGYRATLSNLRAELASLNTHKPSRDDGPDDHVR